MRQFSEPGADPGASFDLFVNQATPEGIGYALMDEAARHLDRKGAFAVITGSLTADNLNEWRKHIKARLAAEYRLRGADACYVAVAVALGISLISWDVEQLERAGPVVRTFRPDEMAG